MIDQGFAALKKRDILNASIHAKRLADSAITYGNSVQQELGKQLYAIADKLGATPGIGSTGIGSATAFASTDKEIKNTLPPPMQANAGSIYNPFSDQYSPPPIRAQVPGTVRPKPIEPNPASDAAERAKEQDEQKGAAFQARLQQTKAGIAARIEVTRQEALKKEKEDAEKRAQNARVNAMEEALRTKREAKNADKKNAAAIARIVSSAQNKVGNNNLNSDKLSQRLIKAKEAVKKNISNAVYYKQMGARNNVLTAQAAAQKDGATDAELLDFLRKYEEYEKNIDTAKLELDKSMSAASTPSINALSARAPTTTPQVSIVKRPLNITSSSPPPNGLPELNVARRISAGVSSPQTPQLSIAGAESIPGANMFGEKSYRNIVMRKGNGAGVRRIIANARQTRRLNTKKLRATRKG